MNEIKEAFIVCLPLLMFFVPFLAYIWFDTWREKKRRSRPWIESMLISRDGQTIYTVRDRDGDEREILHPRRHEWIPISKARFSTLPCFEDYHKDKFNTAIPLSAKKEPT